VNRGAVAMLCAGLLLAGCGAGRAAPAKQRRAGVGVDRGDGIPTSLLLGVRPIGSGPRFRLPVTGTPTGRCEPVLGPRLAAHIELFGANQVLLLAAGIGTKPPWHRSGYRITAARCFGDVVTLDPTGTVYFRPAPGVTLGTVFRAWGETLSASRIASFTGGKTLTYVGGRLWHAAAAAVPLSSGAEIVVEIGPRVPPHTHFAFSQPPSPQMR
jgi:hypothetical protein